MWIAVLALALAGAGQEAEKPRDLKPFEYAEAVIPNYVGSHKLGAPLRKMQLPVDPAESMKHLQVPAGFEVKLFAAEPEIVKPIALAWDARGRLWIAETTDYPNDLQPEGQGRDRIRICEDTDGDGRADKFTVFAEKLSIPTSLCFSNGGLIVSQAPHMLFLKDTDGDDRADERRVLFTGWGTGDTHAGPSNLRWGFDNWVWGMVGYSGFNGTVGGKALRFGAGFFRFKPDGSELEFVRSTNNNSWGVGLSEEGIVFGSTANGNPSEYMPIANRFYERVQGWSAARLNGIAGSPNFHPVTDRVRQVDHLGRFTAAAGHALYTARLFPKEYWNRAAFVCEPTGHLAAAFILEPQGAGFRSSVGWNLAASDDEWTSPIVAEVGPDGAVWMIDWYNYIIQHNPTPAGFKTGKGNAYLIDLRDKKHGRIYRIFPKGARFTPPPPPSLKNDNMLWRMHAQRLMVERGGKDAIPALVELARDPSVDAVGLNTAAIHALWTLHGLGAADQIPLETLQHASAGVRRNAALVLPHTAESAIRALLVDPDAQVRLAALLALSEMPPSPAAGEAVFAMLQKRENGEDRWIPDGATAAAARHDAGFLRSALASLRPEARASSENLVRNPSFETAADWTRTTHGGRAEFGDDASARTGKRCVKIASQEGADASWSVVVEVKPETRYRLAAWVRTKDVKPGSGMGALLNVHQFQSPRVVTPAVTGTSDWKRVEVDFSSGANARLTINCLFGGWGRSTGEAWWDDVSVAEIGESLPGRVGQVVTTVTRHYARRGPVESVVSVLLALKEADERLAGFVLDGLAEGWPAGKAPELAEGALAAVMKALPAAQRERLLALSDRWGRRDLFPAEARAIVEAAAARVATGSADAAKRLLQLEDTEGSVRKILEPVTPLAPPAVVNGLLDALSASRLPATGALVLERWGSLTPATRRAAVALLMRQPAWTRGLLEAVEKGTLARGDLAAEHWQQLKNHPDAELAGRARKIEGAGPLAVSADREALYKKLLPLVERKGDLARGKLVFQNLCSKCHAIDGAGGRVGPELTGFGVHPRHEMLLELVDPNRSVEANYRLWTLKMRDGQVLSGRLDVETQTSVEILDAEGKSHILERKDIELMKASALSIMPVGLIDAAPEEDIVSLLEYLSAAKKK